MLIIGRLSFSDVVSAFYSVQPILGREINPKVYNRLEWQKMVKNKNSFVKEVLAKPKLFILGENNDLK